MQWCIEGLELCVNTFIVYPLIFTKYIYRYFTHPHFSMGEIGNSMTKSMQIMDICHITGADRIERYYGCLTFMKNGHVIGRASMCKCCATLGYNLETFKINK